MRPLRATVGCLLTLISLGCARVDDGPVAESATITVLYPVDEYGLGPMWSWPSQFLVFLPLVERSADGEFEGVLARSWEHSPDYRNWTIHLRADVRWHDGVPVTAHDIKFTLDLLAKGDLWVEPASYSVTVFDDSTYTITYHKRAIGSPLDDYTVYYPKHLLEGLDPDEFYYWEFWKHPIGDGPYRYVRTLPQTMIELEANPDHFRGKPKIERVRLKFGEPSITELSKGDVDVMPGTAEQNFLKLAEDLDFRSYYFNRGTSARAILWNQRLTLFRDQRVRAALTQAIDRRILHQVRYLPPGLPIFDVIFTVSQYRRGELPEPLPYDPERARQLLDEAGWQGLDAGDLRRKDGEAFRFVALVPLGTESDAVYVKDQFNRVGIGMEIVTLEWPSVRDRLLAGDFEAAIFNVTLGNQEQFFGAGSPMGYRNPAVIDLFERARAAMNPDELDSIYEQLMPMFQADLPATFLLPQVETMLAHRRIRGLSQPYRVDPVWYMEHLWIEEE